MGAKNRLYPHLLPDDITLWEQFLSEYGPQFSHFDYDVRVGAGRQADSTLPDNIRKMAIDLSQRRIDAIGHTTDTIWIIEITVSAGLKAIGQLIAYPSLYLEMYPTEKIVKPLLVARELQPDIEPSLRALDISTIIIGP